MAKTLNEKLVSINDSKKAIKQALINKGQNPSDVLSTYADEIANISAGTDTSDATATINDVLSPKTFYAGNKKQTGAIVSNYSAITKPIISSDCIHNNRKLTIMATSYKYKIAVVSSGTDARIYKIEDDNYLSETYTTITLTDVLGSSANNRALNYAGIAYELIDQEQGLVNVYLLANSTGAWTADIVIGICEVNINTTKVEKITKLTVSSMGPYNWYGGAIRPRPNSADCVFLGFSGQSNGTCQQYIAIGRDPSTGTYSARYSNWGDTWNRGDRQRNTTVWSNDGNYLYTSNNKWNRLFQVSPDGYTWTKIVENNLSKPIPLSSEISILNANLYNTSSGELIGPTPNNLSINASTEDYVISNGYLFKLESNLLHIYSITVEGMVYLGNVQKISSLRVPDGDYMQVVQTTSDNVISLLKTTELEKKLTSLTIGTTMYYDTSDGTITTRDILEGKVGYANSTKLTGTMPNLGRLEITPSASVQELEEGYIAGGVINVAEIANSDEYDDCLEYANCILNHTIKKPFIQLEYIQTDGNQWIATGLNASSDLDVEIKFKALRVGTGYGRVIGTTKDCNYEFCDMKNISSYRFSINSGKVKNHISVDNSNFNTAKIIGTGKLYINDQLIIDLASSPVSAPVQLFTCMSGQEGGVLQVIYCKMWKANELVRDYVPSINKKTGVICLYDKVSKEYYYNQGTGNFTGGAEV